MIAIIDYGAGNLMSVQKALDYINCENVITDDVDIIKNAQGVILPGVGSFGDCMDCMRKKGLDKVAIEVANSGKPFLGICLGLQLLFEDSEESPGVDGLGILKGHVKKLPSNNDVKVPHMGWNSLEIKQEQGLFSSINQNSYVYFVHSYYLDASDKTQVAAQTEYGIKFDVAIQTDNIFATQFHPEKSGEIGINILRNFDKLVHGGNN